MRLLRADFRIGRLALAAGLAAAVCGCASAPPPSWQDKLAATGWSVGPEVQSVFNVMFNGFDPLDDTHFVVHVGTTRRVLVTTSIGCTGMGDALRLRYRDRDRVLARLDTLSARGPALPPGRCTVLQINQLVPPRT